MTPQQRGVLNYWLALAVGTIAYDVGAMLRFGRAGTISHVMLDWADRYPWLPLLWLAAALVILWHVAYGFWPLRGD